MNPRRLYRSADDRILAGVAGGVAAYFDVDPVIVRIIWFLSVFFSGSITFWVYLAMVILVPLEPAEWPPESPWAPGGGPTTYPAGYTPPPSGTAPASDAGAAATGTPPVPPMPPTGAPSGWWSNDWRAQRRQERWQNRAERWQQRAERRDYRDHSGPGIVFGLLLVAGGVLLAWHQIDPNVDLGLTWPILVIGLGVILVASSFSVRNRQ